MIQTVIISFLQNITKIIPSELSVFFARYLAWIFGVVLLFFIMQEIVVHVLQRQRSHLQKVLLALLLSTGTAFLVQWVGKFLIYSERPFLQGIQSLYEYGGADSFPSGHSLIFMAIAITVFRFHKSWGIVFIIFAMIIGIFRIVVGIHWPIDVFTGWIIGIIIGLITVRFIKKVLS